MNGKAMALAITGSGVPKANGSQCRGSPPGTVPPGSAKLPGDREAPRPGKKRSVPWTENVDAIGTSMHVWHQHHPPGGHGQEH